MKSRHFSKRLIATLVALVMVVTMVMPVLAACGKKGSTDYTYREYIQKFPNSWSTHNATTDADMYVQGYTEMGLYAYTLSEDKTTYAFVDEMAKGDPANVTESYKGQYGIKENENTADSNVGKAWEITLNPDATWENGEKITADDYVWSMERVLAPEMKNALSSTYITGETAIYNANKYYSYGTTEDYFKIPATTEYTEDDINDLVAEGKLYFNFGINLYDSSPAAKFNTMYNKPAMVAKYTNADGDNIYDILFNKYGNSGDAQGYIKITADNINDFKTNLKVLSDNITAISATMMPYWYCLLSEVKATNAVYNKVPATTEYTDDQINQLIADEDLYFTFDINLYDGNMGPRFNTMYNKPAMVAKFTNADGDNIYDVLFDKYGASVDERGFVKITADNLNDFKTNLKVLSDNITAISATMMPNWYDLLSVRTFETVEETPFENVGIFKTGDKNDSFAIVFENAVTKYQVKNLLTKNWLVYKPWYEEGYTQQGSLTLTTYGALNGKYMGYGPYKLKSFQKDKEIVLERNEKWYGYNEKATNYHEGQFMTDRIVCQVIEDQSTALLEFEKGNIDSVRLSATDMDKYKFSDYLLKRTGGNTWSINFNSDATKLAAIEKDGNNLQILSVYEFRKALSLCLDRAYIGQNILIGSAPAFSFINSNYYYDLEDDPNSIYRNSTQAKQGIVDLYGVEYGEGKTYATLDDAYRAISGYDIDAAKALFAEAYTKAVEGSLYTQGQNIKITIYNNAVSATHTALANYIQQQVTAATVGTSLEGKISVEFKESSTRLADMQNGTVEAIYHSYIADYNNPNGMIAKFTDLKANTSVAYGFDPTTATFDITYDFDGDATTPVETLTKTYDAWQKSIAAGGTYANASNEVRLTILSALEYNLLNNFQTMPLCVGTDLTLRSKKVNYATENANIFVAFGGVRLLTYNYNDGEWANFCKKSSNLIYT